MYLRDGDNAHLQIFDLGDDLDLMATCLIQDPPDEVDIGGSLQQKGQCDLMPQKG